MKKKYFLKIFVLAFFGALVFNACSSDNNTPIDPGPDPTEPVPDGEFANGFFVTNEGQFPNPGSVSFISNDFETVKNNIFQEVNGTSEDLGGVVQSIFFDQEGRAYIISNGANKITVVDRYTFEYVGKIDSGLDAPRYGVVKDGKAYVTNQGDFSTDQDDYVAVIDLDNLSVEDQTTLGGYAEHIFDGPGDRIYVEGTSFNQGNHIFIYTTSSDEVETAVETAPELNTIAVDNSQIYALSPAGIEEFDLDGNHLLTIPLDYDEPVENIRVDEQSLYFTSENKVYSIPTVGHTAPTSPLFEYQADASFGAFYGFEAHNGLIYVADAGDFASNGFVEIHGRSGELKETLNVSVAPGGFFFND